MDKVVILGAGIAGISSSYFLREKGIDSIIYEQENDYGGLCNSFEINGFNFDTFAHISFDINTKKWLEERIPCYERIPEALNYDQGRWIRHPVQNNLVDLPVEERIKHIMGFLTKGNKRIENYGDWLQNTYGEMFAKTYPYRYTRKYWTVEPEQMEEKWIKGRMYEPSIEEVLRGAMTKKTEGVHYSKKAYYPRKGGIKAFLTPLIKEQSIVYNKKVCHINSTEKKIRFQDNSEINYDILVSTIPITELCLLLNDVPFDIVNAASQLDYTSGIMVSLGLNRPNTSPSLWYYIYDEDIWPSRIYSPDWKSPHNVPKGCSAIQAEIYYSKHRPIDLPINVILDKTIDQLLKLKLFSKDEIIVKDIRKKEYANIIFTPEIYSARDKIHRFLDERGIRYAGRFGEWDYLWMGQSLLSGRRVAAEIIEERKQHDL